MGNRTDERTIVNDPAATDQELQAAIDSLRKAGTADRAFVYLAIAVPDENADGATLRCYSLIRNASLPVVLECTRDAMDSLTDCALSWIDEAERRGTR